MLLCIHKIRMPQVVPKKLRWVGILSSLRNRARNKLTGVLVTKILWEYIVTGVKSGNFEVDIFFLKLAGF